MKRLIFLLNKGKFTPPHFSFLLTIVTFVFQSNLMFSQPPASFMYKHNKFITDFDYSDAFITERFEASNPLLEGSIIFQPLSTSPGNVTSLQVTLIDKAGNIQKHDVYKLTSNTEDLIPNASAYNSITKEYIVTGVCKIASNITKYGSWYLLFDDKLNLKANRIFDLTTMNPHQVPQSFGASASTFVTDVCEANDNLFISAGIHFAFTGTILENGNDPFPRVDFLNQPTRRTIFMALLNTGSNNIVLARDFFFSLNIADATKYTYPSRIIETKEHNGVGTAGFIIGGTTSNLIPDDAHRFFYLRTRQDLTMLDHKVIGDGGPGGSDIMYAVNDLAFTTDYGAPEVLVAGTMTRFQNAIGPNGLFFDKIYGTASVASWLDQWPNPGGLQQMGIIELNLQRLGTFPKIGRITPRNLNNTHVITGTLCRNTFYQNPITFLYTNLLPFTIEIDYSANSLNNWTSSQTGLFDLFPRNNGHLGATFYHRAHSMEAPWYPSHKSHAQTLAQTGRDYMLAGLVNEDLTMPLTDYVVQNLTQRPYINNNCVHDEDNGNVTMQLTDIQQFVVYENYMLMNTNDIGILEPTFDVPTMVECTQAAPFRPSNAITSKEYIISIITSGFIFEGFNKLYNLELVDITNKTIKKYDRINYTQENLLEFASGLYLLKIRNLKNEVIETVKLTK